MPFATCRRCQAIFIVSDEDDEPSHNRCPYCGVDLQRVPPEEARRRVEKRVQEDGPQVAPVQPAARGSLSASCLN